MSYFLTGRIHLPVIIQNVCPFGRADLKKLDVPLDNTIYPDSLCHGTAKNIVDRWSTVQVLGSKRGMSGICNGIDIGIGTPLLTVR